MIDRINELKAIYFFLLWAVLLNRSDACWTLLFLVRECAIAGQHSNDRDSQRRKIPGITLRIGQSLP
jgi:hypothetical protein